MISRRQPAISLAASEWVEFESKEWGHQHRSLVGRRRAVSWENDVCWYSTDNAEQRNPTCKYDEPAAPLRPVLQFPTQKFILVNHQRIVPTKILPETNRTFQNAWINYGYIWLTCLLRLALKKSPQVDRTVVAHLTDSLRVTSSSSDSCWTQNTTKSQAAPMSSVDKLKFSICRLKTELWEEKSIKKKSINEINAYTIN